MVEITTPLRRWGNSYGILLPKKVVQQAGLVKGKPVKVEIAVQKRLKVKDIFGKLKWEQSTEEILREIRKNESKWW